MTVHELIQILEALPEEKKALRCVKPRSDIDHIGAIEYEDLNPPALISVSGGLLYFDPDFYDPDDLPDDQIKVLGF